MKKILVLTFAMFLIGVSIANASTLKMSGEYYVRGQWSDNWNGNNTVNGNDSHGIYDHELNLNVNWIMTPYTKVVARLELRDESWAVSTNPNEEDQNGQTDDNIAVERLWAQHTFMNHTTIKVGLMGTATWGSDFSNDSTEAYRLMLIQPTKIGTVIAFTEKNQTYDYDLTPVPGQVNTVNAEESGEIDKDADTYVVALATKIGGITVLPLLKYIDNEPNNLQVIAFDLGANGTFNNIGFEAEFVYVDYNYENTTPDYGIWGVYANVWAQLNALKVGGFIAHGSYDDTVDKGFTFGDDFANSCASGDSYLRNRAMLLGDEVLMYGVSGIDGTHDGELGHNDLNAVTMLALYATYAINEKASVAVFGAYADSNVDLVTNKYDGATAWEVNVAAEYKITPLLTYSIGAATAQKEYGDGSVDPDAAIELSHKLAFTF